MKDKNYSKEITGRIPVNTDYSEIPINKMEEVSNPTITFTEQSAAGADFDIDNDDSTPVEPVEDEINPSYYKKGGYECIDVMEKVFGKEAVAAFCKCNVFKYTYRSPQKKSTESIKKAKWYLEKYMELAPEFFEVWETHPNGLYEVSTLGNVRRVGAVCNRKKVTLKNGYDTVVLSLKDKAYCCYVHRLVAETFLDNPNGYSEINHKNHIRTDNRLENLEWCTRKQNVQDAMGQHIWVYNTDGDFLEEFNSIRDCERFFNFGHRSIADYIDTGKPKGNLLIYTHKL